MEKLQLNNGFCEMSMEEMVVVDGGLLDFLGDIYETWCDVCYDFGGTLYKVLH